MKDKEALQILLSSQGWSLVKEWLEGQVRSRRDAYELEAGKGMDDLIAREYLRGEIAGLRLALELPRKALEAMELEDGRGED